MASLNLDSLEAMVSRQLEAEENLDLVVDDICHHIQTGRFQLERTLETIEEESTALARAKSVAEAKLQEARRREEEEVRREEEVSQLLQHKQAELNRIKEEMDEVGRYVPRLSQRKQLLFSITRLTLDRTAGDRELKGFVVNPRKDDVNTFSFNLNDADVSSQFVRNYLWDVIAAGTNPEWEQHK